METVFVSSIKSAFYYLILAGLLSGCQDRPDGNVFEMNDMAKSGAERSMPGLQAMRHEAISPDAVMDTDIATAGKKVIKTGNIALQVDDLDNARLQVDTLLALYNGYYANESFNDFDQESVYNLTARIPAQYFETFIEGIEKTGFRVVYKNISARDVTEEFIDLEMRLTNRRRYLDRYGELLKQAQTIKDIIDIEENTRKLEEEIESAEGRLKYLTSQIDYSTLFITLTREKEFRFRPDRRDGLFERLKQALSGGWFGLIDFSLFLIKLWPFWIILILLAALLKRYRSRKK